MRATSAFRSSLIALFTLIGVTLDSPAYADGGGISFRVIKAGFVIGGSAGSGSLSFHGRRYPFDIGGLGDNRAHLGVDGCGNASGTPIVSVLPIFSDWLRVDRVVPFTVEVMFLDIDRAECFL